MCAEKLSDSILWRSKPGDMFPRSFHHEKWQKTTACLSLLVKWFLFLLPFLTATNTRHPDCQLPKMTPPRPLPPPPPNLRPRCVCWVCTFCCSFPQAKLCLLLLLLLTQTHKFCLQEHYLHVRLAYPFSSNHSVFLKKESHYLEILSSIIIVLV